MQLAPGINRVGSTSLVNSCLLEEGGEVTIIDAGAPGLWKQVPTDGLAAALVQPGHGDAFAGGIDEAVRLAREAGLPG
jgi:hypothetical protein